MLLQNNQHGAAANGSLKILQKFNMRNSSQLLNKTSISKRQKSYKTEASSFLKTSLNNMIKDQLKAQRLQKKLQKQVQQFKKAKNKKQLIADTHKVQTFRNHQSEILKSKFQAHLKQKQKKDFMARKVVLKKKQFAQKRKQQNSKKIQTVRKRFYYIQSQDIRNRLSRADSIQSNKSIQMSKSKTSLRATNSHASLNHRQQINCRNKGEQQKKIVNFLTKIKSAQSRILCRQIENEQRKMKSIKSQVINLTKERDSKQESRMRMFEQRFQTKMGSFYENLSRSKLQNSKIITNKSVMRTQLRERVMKSKQLTNGLFVNKTMDTFMKKRIDKQNLYSNYQRKMDLLRTKSSFLTNAIKTQKQALKQDNQRSIRKLYEKMNRIKSMKSNETISSKQRENLINILDIEDPLYGQMVQFLSNTKEQFIKKKIQKEEQKAKAEKAKKNTRFNSKG